MFKVIAPHNLRVSVTVNSGSRYKDVYKAVFDKDGSMRLEVVDKTDLYSYIQSFKDSCDLNLLLERFAETGDMSIFNQRKEEPMFGDFAEMPKTVAEMYQRVQDVNDAFLKLDPATREKFNNSASEWLASYGSDDWLSKMGLEDVETPVGATNTPVVVESEVVSDGK